MSGLILKDFLVNRKYLQSGMFLMLFYIVFSLFTSQLSFINMIIILLTTMFVLTTFSYDELAKWNIYALTMPTTRKCIINSKYILTVLIAFIGTMLCLAIQLIFSVILKQPLSADSIMIITVCFLIAVLFNCILIPIVVKIGVEKARIVILGVILIPTILLIILNKIGIKLPSEDKLGYFIPYITIITTLGAVFLLFLSIIISQMIFASKEF